MSDQFRPPRPAPGESRDEVIREYSNGEVTVVWRPALCTHAKFCWRQLPEVFKPRERPWVKIEGADTMRIVAQVEACPSGALSYYTNGVQRGEGV